MLNSQQSSIDERFDSMLDRTTPGQLIVRACELSDRVRMIAFAAIRAENPNLDQRRLQFLLLERLGLWANPKA